MRGSFIFSFEPHSGWLSAYGVSGAQALRLKQSRQSVPGSLVESLLLDLLDLPDAKENEVLKRVARWSLGSNLQQHPKLVEIVRKHANGRPKENRKVIDELTSGPANP